MLFFTAGACTSGQKIAGLVDADDGCGHPLTILGYTDRKRLPVTVCKRCDCTDETRAKRT